MLQIVSEGRERLRIFFDPTLFADGTMAILLDGSELAIMDRLAIVGPGSDLLTVDAQGTSRCFTIAAGADVAMEGLSLTNGYADQGGAIYSEGFLHLEDVDVLANVAVEKGGGIFSSGKLTIVDSAVSGNSVTVETGGSGGGIHSEGGTLRLLGAVVSDNSLPSLESCGGGISVEDCMLEVSGSTISGNTAVSGGGIYGNGSLLISDSAIVGNESPYRHSEGGGGIYLLSGDLALIRTTVSDNDSSGPGGGIRTHGTTTVIDCTISGNRIGLNYVGGGIANEGGALIVRGSEFRCNKGGYGGGIFNSGTVSVLATTFFDNDASRGGGVFNQRTAELANTTFILNSASTDGGAVCNSGANLLIENSLFALNVMDGFLDGGGAISNTDNGTLSVTNSTLAYNSATFGPCLLNEEGTVQISNSILWNDGTDEIYGEGDTDLLTNLIGIDPAFQRIPDDGGDGWGDDPRTEDVDESLNDDYGDLHLTAHSPALEYADDALLCSDRLDLDGDGVTDEPIPFDRDGNPRVFGTRADCGAYEFQAGADPELETPSTVVTTPSNVVDLLDNQISLREAIHYAGRSDLEDTVTFDASMSGEVVSMEGLPFYLDGRVNIDGTALDENVTLDAGGQSRVFTLISSPDRPVELAGLTLRGGYAKYGGAVYNSGALTIRDSMLTENATGGGLNYGGAVYNTGTLTTTNSTFSGNHSSYGGGVYTTGPVVVTDSVFTDNGGGDGAAIYNLCSSVSVFGSLFSYNIGGIWGGAIVNRGNGGEATLSIADSAFYRNDAQSYGGAIYSRSDNEGSVRTDIVGSTFMENSATGYYGSGAGGAINHNGYGGESAFLTVSNSIFSGNTALSSGGALSVGDNSTAMFINSTISQNATSRKAGGFSLYGSSITITLNNTIVAGNTGYEGGADVSVASDYDGTLSGSHNLIGNGSGQAFLQDGVDGNVVGTAENPIDPLLSNRTQRDDGTWALYLLPGSPALDVGANELAVDAAGDPLLLDVLGNDRIQGETVDIGAVEGATSPTRGQSYVVTSLEKRIDATDGELTLWEAVEAANRNQPVGDAPAGSAFEQDTIRFADGLGGTVVLGGEEISFGGDTKVVGPGADLLTFDAGGLSRVFSIQLGASVDLTGLTITGGAAEEGGGVLNWGFLSINEATIDRNAIVGGTSKGGGILNNGTCVVSHSVFSQNGTSGDPCDGGSIYNVGACEVSHCLFVENTGDSGGVILTSGSLLVQDSAFHSNTSYAGGGAIYNIGQELKVVNSSFHANEAMGSGLRGGAIYSGYHSLTLVNCAVWGNSALRGGGIYVENQAEASIHNTLIARNFATTGPDLYWTEGTGSGSHNLIGDGSGQTLLADGTDGNMVGTAEAPIDPLLSEGVQLDDGRWAYWLLPGSPALDAGDNARAVGADGQPLLVDLRGNQRVSGGTVDIGAVEGANGGSDGRVYVVTSLADVIEAGDGQLTFREAFEAAARNCTFGDAPAGSYSAQDTIRFADGLSGELRLNGKQLSIDASLAIEGPGVDQLTFDAQGLSRVFCLYPTATVELSGMTISGGAPVIGNGGGVMNYGTLVLSEAIVAGNRTPIGSGGGIMNYGALSLSGTIVVGNHALDRSGGGIDNASVLTILNSTIKENTGSSGGGVMNTGRLAIVDSKIVDNVAEYKYGRGGGLFTGGEGRSLFIANSLVCGNSAVRDGDQIAVNNGAFSGVNLTVIPNADSTNNSVYIGCAFHLTANSGWASAKLFRIVVPEGVPAVGLDGSSQGEDVLAAGAGPAHPAATQSLFDQYLAA